MRIILFLSAFYITMTLLDCAGMKQSAWHFVVGTIILAIALLFDLLKILIDEK